MISLRLGDCLDALRDVPQGVDMVFADLPYGATRNKWDTKIDLARLWSLLLSIAKPNAALVFTATQPFATTLINSQPKLFRYDLIWEKDNVTGFLNAKRMPLRIHEHVLIFYRALPTYTAQLVVGTPYKYKRTVYSTNYGTQRVTAGNNQGSRQPQSIVRLVRDSNKHHPTQKPVALIEWLIKTYTNPGDTVLDPVMGSGTTAIACINTGRNCIAIEKDGTYFLTAAKRIGEALAP